jgi:hypothetical protein
MQPDVFNNETLHVVDYFNGALQIKNEKVINDVFTNYVLNKSKVDFNANRSTADNINKLNQEINRENKEVKASKFWMIFFRIIGVALAFVGIIFIVLISLHHNEKISPI